MDKKALLRFSYSDRSRARLIILQKIKFYSGFLETTKINVAKGPKIILNKNQLKPDLFFPCAIPAFINDNVPHPTAY